MELTQIDSTGLNGSNDMLAELTVRGSQAREVSTTLRQRSQLPPAVDDVQYVAWTRTVLIHANQDNLSDNNDQEAFDELVQQHWRADAAQRTLYATHGDPAETYTMIVRILRLVRSSSKFTWEATIQATDPAWVAATDESSFSATVTNDGNVEARPKITVTNGDSVTRKRVTITSSDPLRAYPIGVSTGSAEANHVVWHHGRRVPFTVESGYIWFLVDTDLRRDTDQHRALVDIYYGASISNTTDPAAWNDAGITYDSAINSGTIVADPTTAMSNPKSPAFAWQPIPATKHAGSRNYTFGIENDIIRMIDRQDTGNREQLADDYDAIAVASPTTMSQIANLDFDVFVGYRIGQNEYVDESGTNKRVMRCTIAQYSGEPIATNEYGSVYWTPTGLVYATDIPSSAQTGQHNYPWYLQWTFGDTTFPYAHVHEQENDDVDDYSNPRWFGMAGPADFEDLVTEWIGCPISQGEPGVYYLEFDEDSFSGIEDIPLITMSINNRGELFSNIDGTDLDRWPGDAGPKPANLFESVWVDPNTLEPFEDEAEGSSLPEQSIIGTTRAVVLYWTDDSPEPNVAWSRTLRGAKTPADAEAVSGATVAGGSESIGAGFRSSDPNYTTNGVTYEFRGVTASTPGAVMIAVGLQPAAADLNEVDWGELQFIADADNATISMSTPSIASATTAAQRLDGQMTNGANNDAIIFDEVFSDSGGLEIDTGGAGTYEVVRGAGGVGPVYGGPTPSNGARWFDLEPGSNTISKTGNISTVQFEWNNRMQVNS